MRQELQMGADQIKIMASGGVASPTDPVGAWGYSEDEIRAIVAEARARQTHVLAHAYTAEAISRAVRCGVRTIEHGNLVDAEAARLMAGQGAYVVPTLITYEALANEGADLGLPADSVAKVAQVRNAGLHSLEIYRDAGVPMGFGTDLLGPSHRLQSEEFRLRAEVLGAPAVIASATQVGAGAGHGGQAGRHRAGRLRRHAGGGRQSAARRVLPAGAGRAHPAGDAERQGAVRRAGRLSGRRGGRPGVPFLRRGRFRGTARWGLPPASAGLTAARHRSRKWRFLSASWYTSRPTPRPSGRTPAAGTTESPTGRMPEACAIMCWPRGDSR